MKISFWLIPCLVEKKGTYFTCFYVLHTTAILKSKFLAQPSRVYGYTTRKVVGYSGHQHTVGKKRKNSGVQMICIQIASG